MVAIIGILAAVAIPAYQDYIARAQVSEAVNLLGGSKTPVAEFIADNGRFPAGISSVVPNTSGSYVSYMTFNGVTGATGAVVAYMKGTDVNANIRNGTVEMYTNTGGNQWTCRKGSVGTALQQKYLPGACKD
ncbi:MAG: pilin [Gammaproteobacteria bacterium]|nr:pilin [Gammaproteobacteria bacterium]